MQTVNSRELVIARYKENVDWLRTLSPAWKITIYNKGDPVPAHIQALPNVTVITIGNKGREAETIAYHLVHRYDSISDFTVFLQASPHDHAPELTACLSSLQGRGSFSAAEKYIPVTIRYNSSFPPPHITNNRANRFYRVEDMSVYTLDCIEHIDNIGAAWITPHWRSQTNLLPGTNVMKYFFDSIGWPGALQPGQPTIKFSYAACFGVTKQAVLQHSHDFYKRLYPKTFDMSIAPYILERAWLHIFNQSFDASAVLPEFTLPNRVAFYRKLQPQPQPRLQQQSPVQPTGNRRGYPLHLMMRKR